MKEVLEHLPTDVIALMALIAMVWGTIVIRLGQRDHDKKLKEVRTQVVNDHPLDGPNLREDVEEIKKASEAALKSSEATLARLVANEDWIRGVYTRVESIGRELHDERQRSINADTALHQLVARHYAAGIDPAVGLVGSAGSGSVGTGGAAEPPPTLQQ